MDRRSASARWARATASRTSPRSSPPPTRSRLVEALARTGLRRLEVTSFVRADVIPQLADGAEVLRGGRHPGRRGRVGADPQRARARQRARAARPLPGGQPVPLRVGDPQPQEREPLDRGVAHRAGARDRARARGGAALRGRDLGGVRLPVRGRGARRSACSSIAERLRDAGCEEIAFGDTTGMANPAQVREFYGRRVRAAAGRGADRPLPQHPRSGAGERAAPRSRPGCARSSRPSASWAAAPCRRARRATWRARTWCRCCTRWATTPGSTCPRCSTARATPRRCWAARSGSHVLTAGPVDWHRG